MEALRLEASKTEAKSQRLARDVAKATESAKTACRTLRLAHTDMGARVRGVPGEDASAFEFSEWTQLANGAVSDCATTYGDCSSGCEHIAKFPDYAKGDWEFSAQDVSPTIRAWRKQFWQKDDRSTAKARLLEQLAKTEAVDQDKEPVAERGGGDAQDVTS
uniref:Uncharacterized protein n=1 Tax=Oryza punctata TaxID=4537 RepID=A0A0E0MLY2_ORYPU